MAQNSYFYKFSEAVEICVSHFTGIHIINNATFVCNVQVIHYELPNTSELFVHRSGRTGRAGKKGSAILIYSPEQARAVRGIEGDVGCRFTEVFFLSPTIML